MTGWGLWSSGASQAAPPAEADKRDRNFFPVTDAFKQDELCGHLSKTDLNWTCPTRLSTETQTWYSVLTDGSFITSQIIYSPVGLFNPQVQMTFKYFNPKTGKKVWKSKNVDSFTPLEQDRRSSKSNVFSVTFKDLSDGAQSYDIHASFDSSVQLLYTMTRPAAVDGWKTGDGKYGGFSYFGEDRVDSAGYVVHRFWPRAMTSGLIVIDGQAFDVAGQGMFVQAIQGMRPNLVASRWNFCNFQSAEFGGVSAILMELTTTCDYGDLRTEENGGKRRVPQTATYGSVVCGDKLVAVVAATRDAAPMAEPRHSQTAIDHEDLTFDESTGYRVPQKITYKWDGPAVSTSGRVDAALTVELGAPQQMQGLVDKVDVLAEIPYVVRKLVNYVAGTKPYIYQTLHPAELTLSLPEEVQKQVAPEASGPLSVKGTLFEEHTFISE
ncbi:Putative cell survival pathways protein [Malassezia sp. CBS 17886]|nr:Putative cell survival pathways protein [Malassezia sp. CBS 17886]